MIAIVDYGAGNIRSVQNALKTLGNEAILTANPDTIKKADKVIFPGVGAAGFAMQQLKDLQLDKVLPCLDQPFLGICLGQQLMCSFSEEDNTPCLGIFDTEVKKFETTLPVPHMGWNTVFDTKGALWDGIPDGTDFYFVHSYYVKNQLTTTGKTTYQKAFSASLEKDNFFAVQFHPEKSGKAGLQLLQNFLNL